jgi:hypothetical protein
VEWSCETTPKKPLAVSGIGSPLDPDIHKAGGNTNILKPIKKIIERRMKNEKTQRLSCRIISNSIGHVLYLYSLLVGNLSTGTTPETAR